MEGILGPAVPVAGDVTDVFGRAERCDPACSSRNTVKTVFGGSPEASTWKLSKPTASVVVDLDVHVGVRHAGRQLGRGRRELQVHVVRTPAGRRRRSGTARRDSAYREGCGERRRDPTECGGHVGTSCRSELICRCPDTPREGEPARRAVGAVLCSGRAWPAGVRLGAHACSRRRPESRQMPWLLRLPPRKQRRWDTAVSMSSQAGGLDRRRRATSMSTMRSFDPSVVRGMT